MKSLGVDGALTEVAPAFDAAGIEWFTAKGPAIAYVDYPDPALRPYTDLDVYVPEHHRADAVAVLTELGYDKVPQAVGPLGGLPCEYHGGRFGAVVELHSHVIDNIHRRWLPPLPEWMPHVVRAELCGVERQRARARRPRRPPGHPPRRRPPLPEADAAAGPAHRRADRRPTRSLAADRYLADIAGLLGRLRSGDGGSLRCLSSIDPCAWDENARTLRNARALDVAADAAPCRAGPRHRRHPSLRTRPADRPRPGGHMTAALPIRLSRRPGLDAYRAKGRRLAVAAIPHVVFVLAALVATTAPGFRAVIALGLGAGAVAMAAFAPRQLLVAVMVWLPFLGLLRRVLSWTTGEVGTDPLLLVAPIALGALTVVAIERGALRDRTVLAKGVLALCVLSVLSVANPAQGGPLAGLGGLLFFLVPMLGFWIGRSLVDDELLKQVTNVIAVLALVAAAYGLWQVYVEFLPWDAQWINEKGYTALNVGDRIRPFSMFASSAEYAYFCALGLVVWFAHGLRIGRAGPASVAVAFLGVAVFLQGSRGHRRAPRRHARASSSQPGPVSGPGPRSSSAPLLVFGLQAVVSTFGGDARRVLRHPDRIPGQPSGQRPVPAFRPPVLDAADPRGHGPQRRAGGVPQPDRQRRRLGDPGRRPVRHLPRQHRGRPVQRRRRPRASRPAGLRRRRCLRSAHRVLGRPRAEATSSALSPSA